MSRSSRAAPERRSVIPVDDVPLALPVALADVAQFEGEGPRLPLVRRLDPAANAIEVPVDRFDAGRGRRRVEIPAVHPDVPSEPASQFLLRDDPGGILQAPLLHALAPGGELALLFGREPRDVPRSSGSVVRLARAEALHDPLVNIAQTTPCYVQTT